MRKRLLRPFADFAGIYGLYCEQTGKWYVGASLKVKTRIRTHLSQMQNPNSGHPMAHDVVLYGMASIKTYTLEEVEDKHSLVHRERYWVQEKDALENGYNRMPPGRSGGWMGSGDGF